MSEIVTGIITYEPTRNQVDLLSARLAKDSSILVWDNSATPQAQAAVRQACVATAAFYGGDGTNRGTGFALNCLLREAAKRSASWLVYYDQDTRVLSPHDEEYLRALSSRVAMVGSSVQLQGTPTLPDRAAPHALIASGTAFRVSAMLATGGFDESFFLDLVDTEACWRARTLGYEMRLSRSSTISHEIGAGGIALGSVATARHPRWRRRQMWRNSLWLVGRYWRQLPGDSVKHVAARIAETSLAAIHYRRLSYLLDAAAGTWQARRATPRHGIVGYGVEPG